MSKTPTQQTPTMRALGTVGSGAAWSVSCTICFASSCCHLETQSSDVEGHQV